MQGATSYGRLITLAKMEVTIPTDLIRKLEKMGSKGEEIGKKMLNAGARILRAQVDSNLKKVLYTNRSNRKSYPTGALERSITIDKPKRSKNGNLYIRIYFKGKDSNGVSNGLKAAILEHGKSDQPKRPFVRSAVEQTEDEINKEMQRIFDSEISKL